MNYHLSEITEFKYTSLIKNDYSRREFQMALRGFCIWTHISISWNKSTHFMKISPTAMKIHRKNNENLIKPIAKVFMNV